jgi:hypothetical protein
MVSYFKGSMQIEGIWEWRAKRRMFEHKRAELTGGLRKLHDKEFHDLYLNVVSLQWLIRGGWGGWTCSIYGEMKNSYVILIWKLKGRGHRGDLSPAGRVILKFMLEKL